MDGLRTEANAETDALYPAEWIDAQRHSILRRRAPQPRAVITFPGRLVTQQMAKGIELRVSPWAATAAAACLFVGVALGMFDDVCNHLPRYAIVRAVPGPTAVQATAGAVAPVALDTDAFLSELERALGGPQTWSS